LRHRLFPKASALRLRTKSFFDSVLNNATLRMVISKWWRERPQTHARRRASATERPTGWLRAGGWSCRRARFEVHGNKPMTGDYQQSGFGEKGRKQHAPDYSDFVKPLPAVKAALGAYALTLTQS
jgi:hypothetical protein